MKKQTAVDWLIKIYLQTGKIDSFDINQAKAMEKEQIENAFMVGVKNEKYRFDTKEQYYTETYGK
jgi:hypothetical protein